MTQRAAEPSPRASFRTPYLLTPITLLFVAGCVYALRVWIARGDSVMAQKEAELATIMRDDPPLGTHIMLPFSFPQPDQAVIIICATLCDCNLTYLEDVSRRGPTQVPIRVLCPVDADRLEQVPSMRRYRGLFVFDPNLVTAKRLNAMFMPRAYLLDKSGLLLWRSEHYEPSWQRLIEAGEHALDIRREAN